MSSSGVKNGSVGLFIALNYLSNIHKFTFEEDFTFADSFNILQYNLALSNLACFAYQIHI